MNIYKAIAIIGIWASIFGLGYSGNFSGAVMIPIVFIAMVASSDIGTSKN